MIYKIWEKVLEKKTSTMGFFIIEKNLNLNNICKGFKAIGIWPLNPNAMVNKMQPIEAFVKMETPHLNFDQVEL